MPGPLDNLDEAIRELQDLYDDPDIVTTTDKIQQPDPREDVKTIDAINAFMQRNPKADGGMLVQPSTDGSRPGYAEDKDFFVYKNQYGETKIKRPKGQITVSELTKLDFPISEPTIKSTLQSKDDRNKAYKKIFKDNGIKPVGKGPKGEMLFKTPTKNQLDGVWKDTIELVKSGKATVPDKMREPFKKEVLKIFDEFSKSGTPFSTKDIYYKLVENVQDNPRIYVPRKHKGGTRVPGEVIKTALGKERSSLLMDGNLQRIEKTIGNRKKLVDILSKGKSDPDTLSKTLGISKKDLFAEASTLFDDVYRYTRTKVKKSGFGEKYGYLKDLEVSDYKNILNNLRASGFEKLDRRSMRALITEAYAETNPKKFKAAVDRLNEYTKTNAELKRLFGFGFELDHPLSFQALKNLKNVSPENLLRVNPIPAQLNKVKIGLDKTYGKILNNIRQGNSSPELLNQKKAIETLSSKLGLGQFKIDKTGQRVLSFGADPFLKTNLPQKMGENIFLQDRIAKNLKNVDPNLLTQALGERSRAIKSIQNLTTMEPQKVKGLKAFMKANGIKCLVNRSTGGPVTCDMPQAYTKSLNELSEKAAQGDQAAKTTLSKFGNKVATAGRVIKGALGPLALATEAAVDLAIPLNQTMQEGVPYKQAFADTLINKYLLGPKLQVDKEAEIAKEMAKGEEFAMAERGRRMAPFMPQSAQADKQRVKERMDEMKALYPQYSDQDIINFLEIGGYDPKDVIGKTTTTRITPAVTTTLTGIDQLKTAIQEQQALDRIAEEGGVANLAKGGRAGYNDGKLVEPVEIDQTGYVEKSLQDMHKHYKYYKKMGGRMKKRQFASNFFRQYHSSGGIASGPPPEKGPNSQGLQGLLNRVKKPKE